MALPQQKFREAVFQLLYSASFTSKTEEEAVSFMMQELKTTRKAIFEAKAKVDEILVRCSELDERISSVSTEYSLERISRVELILLRLGLFELLFTPDAEPEKIIAEGIRLCRKFGTPESAEFVHAILDGAYRKHAASLADITSSV